MTGPKHLWSGDWERESAASSGAEAGRRQDHQDPAVDENAARTPAQEPTTIAAKNRRRNRIAAASTLTVLVLAAIAIAAASGGSDPTRATAPTAAAQAPSANPAPTQPTNPNPTNPNPTNPNPTNPSPAIPTNPNPPTPSPTTPPSTSSTTTAPPVAPQPINWLGMEIITVPGGSAVVDTVTPGGAGDKAGLTPADTIVQIDNHAVTGSASIARAVRGKRRGDMVTVTVVRGGTSLDVRTSYSGPPTAYP